MEEIEIPTEQLQEEIHKQLELQEAGGRWLTGVALSSALLAVIAAVAGLLAGHHANEAVLNQIRASDSWNFYQAKGIKAAVANSTKDVFVALDKPLPPDLGKSSDQYAEEQEQIKKKAEVEEEESQNALKLHMYYARSVTLFQVAIALGAIAALVRKKNFWFVSMLIGACGVFFFAQGLFAH